MILPRPPSLTEEQLRRYHLQKAEELFEGSIDRMRPEAKAAFMALCNCHKEKEDVNDPLFGCGPLLGIVNTNGLSLDGLRPGMPDETKTYSVVCKHISRLNHSCSPNTMPQFDDPSFSCRLYAVRDIAVGEELTYNYISTDDVLLPAAARQAVLQSAYNFVCSCPACEDPSTSNPCRAAIAVFAAAYPREPQLTVDAFSFLDDTRLAACRKQAALIEREGLEHLPVYFSVLKMLVEASLARGDVDSAFTSAQKLDKSHWISACDALQDNPLWRAVVDTIIPNFQAHRRTTRG
ncbi:SET domain-containing protein [Mycena sanguinolenta]|uniref:SET domain-containing protein n=1 Tax=Mycena sanguinolenta TaxID=230812 RepID=A0A8H6Y1V4_9AGAR|nr:SET domain-containing protein [Mycena sanguinolenta]